MKFFKNLFGLYSHEEVRKARRSAIKTALIHYGYTNLSGRELDILAG